MQDLVQQFDSKKLNIELASHLWAKIDAKVLNIVQNSSWTTFKYFNDDKSINAEIENVSNTRGGIYLFYVSPEVIKEKQRFLMYVGKAQITEYQNLRKRIREYKGYMPPDCSRPKVNKLFREWWEYIYCSYIEFDDNQLIDYIEEELINTLIPPINDKYARTEISVALKQAFLI